MNKLNHHLRQYQHNDSSGLIHAYELKGTEVFVSCLEAEISRLKTVIDGLNIHAGAMADKIEKLTLANAGLNSRLTNFQKLYNDLVDENNGLKAMVEELKEAAYIVNYCASSSSREKAQVDRSALDKALFIANKTPRQCLAIDRAQAIRDAIANSEQIQFEGSHYVGTYVSLEDLEVNIKQLQDSE